MFNRIDQVTAHNRRLKKAASEEKGAPQKLSHLVPAQMYGIKYADSLGNVITTVVFKIGDGWYMDVANGQEWAEGLSPCAPWLVKQLESAAVQARQPAAPTNDSVEIFVPSEKADGG